MPLALMAALVLAPAAFGNALDQYDENIPDVSGEHKPTSDPENTVGLGSPGGTDDDGTAGTGPDGAAGGDSGAGEENDDSGLAKLGDAGNATADDPLGIDSGDGGPDPGQVLQSGNLDAPPVSGWVIATLAAALLIAAIRAGIAIRGARRNPA